MTKQEWIDQDRSFYHITQTRNIQGIVKSGLKNVNGRGICVVRTNDERIVRFICEMMLVVDTDLDFSVIEIKPNRISLKANEILVDGVVECTDPLHNYISRNQILIAQENIVGTFRANPIGIPDLHKYEAMLRQEFVLEQLA